MFEPKNEQGTIVYFQQVGQQLGYELVSIQSAYPDAVVHDNNNGKDLRVEFEYNSDNFRIHNHDPKGCDLVICWKKGGTGLEIPVLELCSMKTYPPHSSSKKRSNYPPKELRHRSVLDIGNRIGITERNDGKEVRAIIIPEKGPNVYGIEAFRDDSNPSSVLLWKALVLAKEIREQGNSIKSYTREAYEVANMVIDAYNLRQEEQAKRNH